LIYYVLYTNRDERCSALEMCMRIFRHLIPPPNKPVLYFWTTIRPLELNSHFIFVVFRVTFV
jgi:hypothetical protein